jgi:hypothetical protein
VVAAIARVVSDDKAEAEIEAEVGPDEQIELGASE